jgi:hypothetical protein
MLANQEDFDHKVKRVLQEVNTEEIPLDFLVDIEQRLDQLEKKKKRRVFIWFFVGIVLASGFTYGLLHENESSKTSAKIPTLSISNQPIKPQLMKQLSSSKENKTIETMNVESAAVISTSGVTRTMSSVSPVKANINRFDRKNPSDVLEMSKPLSDIKSSKVQLTTSEMTQNHQGMISAQKNDVPSAIASVKSEVTNIEENPNHKVDPSTSIPEVAPTINDLQVKTNSTSSNPAFPEPGILPIEKEKWVQTFGFFTGVSGIISSIELVESTGFNANPWPDLKKYAEIRNAQERSTSSIDLSLRTSWMKHHFLIQTGVDYFEWGEQLQYDYNIVYDGVNRYSYVSIPLYLGYRHSWNNLELSASVGSSIGGVIKREGHYIQENLTTIALEQASNWTTTGHLQLELCYVKDNYRFSIAPTYRRSLTSVIFSGYTRNNYQSIGLQMGISVILK